MTKDPGKEYATNKLPPTGRIWEGPKRGKRLRPIICLLKLTGSIREGSKGGRRCQPIILSCQPPRILFTGIHLGCKMYISPGRTLSQTKYGHKHDDWSETTGKLTPLQYNLRLWGTWQSSSPGFPYSAALCPGSPFQQSLLLCQHVCLLRQFISEC